MIYSEILAKLIYLTKRNDITHVEIGKCINAEKGAITARSKRNSKFKPSEIEQIEAAFDVNLKDAQITTNSFMPIQKQTLSKEESLEAIGRRLSLIQEELGYLDKAMARLMNIDETRYIKIKLGKNEATIGELIDLTSKVDVSLDWLIGND